MDTPSGLTREPGEDVAMPQVPIWTTQYVPENALKNEAASHSHRTRCGVFFEGDKFNPNGL
jgi:hypothetical protein